MKLPYTKILVFIFLIFSVISCNGQKEEQIVKKVKINNTNKSINNTSKKSNGTNKKGKVVKKLDRKKLEKYKMNNQLRYTENDSIFKLDDQQKTYREVKNKIGDQLKTVSFYDKNKLVLLAEGNYMFDFPIGIHISYDLEGNIIKEQDFDKDFPFNFQKLKQKLLNEFNINLDNTKLDLEINRGLDTSDMKYNYTIFLYNEGRLTYRYILVDGVTGNTIKDLNVRALD